MRSIKTAACICLFSVLFTACQKDTAEQPKTPDQIANAGFENALTGWQTDSAEAFQASADAAKSGQYGLQFSVPADATPWNGKMYQTLKNLPDGEYMLSVAAEALGSGMYLWANGGSGDQTAPIQQAVPGMSRLMPLQKLEFTVTGGEAKIGFACINALPDTVQRPANIAEAESAFLNKVTKAANHTGFTGAGFADFSDSSDAFIEWTVNKPASGEVSLAFRYANGATADRPLKLEVNGVVVSQSVAFPPTGGWSKWATTANVTTNLTAGANKIRLTGIGKNGANIDHLSWSDVLRTPYFVADDVQLTKKL